MSLRLQVHFQLALPPSKLIAASGDWKKDCKKIRNSTEIDGTDVIYSFNHIYPESENNSVGAILYAEIGSEELKSFRVFGISRSSSCKWNTVQMC